MQGEALKRWRKEERQRLVAARLALDAATLRAYQSRMDRSLEKAFPGLAQARIGFCWPIKNEYDARHLLRTLRERGANVASARTSRGPNGRPAPALGPTVATK